MILEGSSNFNDFLILSLTLVHGIDGVGSGQNHPCGHGIEVMSGKEVKTTSHHHACNSLYNMLAHLLHKLLTSGIHL